MTKDQAIIAARSASSRKDNAPFVLTRHTDGSWSHRLLTGTPLHRIAYSEADEAAMAERERRSA